MSEKIIDWLMGELHELRDEVGSDGSRGHPGLLLALDQGGHASRAVVFDPIGCEIARAHAPIGTQRSVGERVEHDATEVLESMRTAISDVCEALDDRVQDVVAAGLATQRSSVVAWDRQTQQPLSAVLSWQDRRNATWLEALGGHADTIRELTGLVLSPHYGASKLRWLLDHEPAVATALERQRLALGPLASYLLDGLLSPSPCVSDPANASRTQLWDYRSGDWSERLLDLFGVPRSCLPRCVPTRHAFGVLDLGLKSVPLVVATGDQSAAVFASGPIAPGTVYLNLGTGAFVLAALDEPVAPAGLLASVLYADQRRTRFALEGTVNGAGSALSWIDERVGLDAHRAALTLTPQLIDEFEPPLFVNGVSGVGSPFWASHLESDFVGDADETAQVAAVLESIAFLIAENINRMRAAGVTVARLLASGGLASSDYLCQCIATVCCAALARSEAQEATARGLAWLIAGGSSEWQPATSARDFVPAVSSRLLERFARWQTLMRERLPQRTGSA